MNFEVQPACLFFYLRRPIVTVCLWRAEKKKQRVAERSHLFPDIDMKEAGFVFF